VWERKLPTASYIETHYTPSCPIRIRPVSSTLAKLLVTVVVAVIVAVMEAEAK